MGTSNARLRHQAENSPIRECNLPILICNGAFDICFANNSAKELSEEFTAGGSVLTLIPTLSKEQFDEQSARCLAVPIPQHGIYTSAAVTSGNAGKARYYAVVFRSYPILPPQNSPWYVNRNYSCLADSMDKLMSHTYKTDKSIIKYEAQLTRFCAYLFNKSASLPVNTNVNELLSAIIDTVTPMLSTLGVSAELGYEDTAYTTLDSPIMPVADLMIAMILALVLFSETGRLKIHREQVQDTELLELSARTKAEKKVRNRIKSFDDLLSYAEPICVELAALKDRADANGVRLDLRYDEEDLVLYYHVKGRISDSVEFKSPELIKDAADHFAALSTSLFELVKTSFFKKEV